jgi:hypothetical protein
VQPKPIAATLCTSSGGLRQPSALVIVILIRPHVLAARRAAAPKRPIKLTTATFACLNPNSNHRHNATTRSNAKRLTPTSGAATRCRPTRMDSINRLPAPASNLM